MNISILGSSKNTPFDVRIFNLSTLIASVLGITTVLINLVNVYPLGFDISVCITASSFIILYYLSRFKQRTRHLKIPFLLVMIVSMSYAWFYNEGIMGSTSYLFGFTCLATPFIFKSSKYIVLSIVIMVAVLLILIQLYYPHFIMPYPSYEARFSDNAFTLIAILIITGFTIALFMKNLEREQQTIVNQNHILKEQKEEISVQAEKLLEINNQLTELDKFKELMTGMVIHDLKNPLVSIIGLSDQKYSGRNLQLIKQSGKQMLNLVENILDVQKFENTQIKLNCENTPLQNIIQKAISDISGSIEEKNLELNFMGQIDCMVFVDVALIERVFTNILGNAIKYSDNNAKIEVHCNQTTDNQFVRVSIKDYGPGIEADKIPNVFIKFSQVNSRKSGSLRSTGLGLAFCKMAIEAHNCEIGVGSELNKSTTFWFTLQKSVLPEYEQFQKIALHSKKSEISLTAQEMDYLETHLAQLKKLKYYEIGKLIPLLASINEGLSPNIAKWKTEMENSVYSNNELVFNELLK